MTLLTKAKFWNRVKDTLAIGGLLTQGGFELANASEDLRMWVLAGNIAAYLVGMWFSDVNNDGIVDLFEDENQNKQL